MNASIAGDKFEEVTEHPSMNQFIHSDCQPLEKMPVNNLSLTVLIRLSKASNNLHLMHHDLWSTLGQIYMVPIPSAPPFVMTSNPADVEVLFRTEGETPYRAGFEMVEEFLEKKGLAKGMVMS